MGGGDWEISIHALREEGDNRTKVVGTGLTLFLSTPSARRATFGGLVNGLSEPDFYPRPPRGGRRKLMGGAIEMPYISIHALREEGDTADITMYGEIVISIHALREEGDSTPAKRAAKLVQFLSTPSARRATKAPAQSGKSNRISIHALREEGDSKNRDKISIFKQIIQHSARI